jgi:hypothetical protein
MLSVSLFHLLAILSAHPSSTMHVKELTCSLALRPNTTKPSTATAPATAAATHGTQSPGCRNNSDRHSTGRPFVAEPLRSGYGGLMISWELGINASRIV